MLTQAIFKQLDDAGFIADRTIRQAYSPTDGRFLPDRYVLGTCPRCGDRGARGDQCEACATLLDPAELVEPRSAVSGARDVEFRETRHLFFRLAAFAPRLRLWIEAQDDWPALVRGIALKWLDEGLADRCITRDLAWGVPVPKPGFESKVFYVWFDAPIGYIAAAVEWAEGAPGRDWRAWWQGGDAVRLVQFLAKDNVPFHTVSFPATLLGSGAPLKLPDLVKGFNYLTYEGGKFSTSRNHGIFTDAAIAALPADYWRWYLAAHAPETADSDFTPRGFADCVNKDLVGVFGNLVHRCLSFATLRFDGRVPAEGTPGDAEAALAAALDRRLAALRRAQDAAEIRKAAAAIRAIWSLGNAYLSEEAPWTAIRTDRRRAAAIIRAGINLVRTAAIAAWPVIPASAERVLRALGEAPGTPTLPTDGQSAFAAIAPGRAIAVPPLLFDKLAAEDVARIGARDDRGAARQKR